MSTAMWKPVGPMSSSEFQIVDGDRLADIQHKHAAVKQLLQARQLDAILLQRPSNFAWFTSGGDCSRGGSSDASAALFITADARVVVTNNAESAQLFDRELQGLGFQLKERPWHEPRATLMDDLCRGRNVASDARFNGTPTSVRRSSRCACRSRRSSAASSAIWDRRWPTRSRRLAAIVSRAKANAKSREKSLTVSSDTRSIRSGSRSAPTAGRPPIPIGHSARSPCSARSPSRPLAGGRAVPGRLADDFVRHSPDELQNDHHKTNLIQASGMFFTQANFAMFEIWSRVARIYEKFKCDDSWERTEQAEVIGYELAEYPVVPRSEFQIAPRMPVYWHPAVGAAMSGDTILVGDGQFEVLTPRKAGPRSKWSSKGPRSIGRIFSSARPSAGRQFRRLSHRSRHHRPQLFADFFDLVLAVAAAHGLKRRLIRPVLQDPLLGELPGLDLVQNLLHFPLGLFGHNAGTRV